MTSSELVPLSLDDTLCFECHPGVPCFNHCCRDLNQALTPYDILCLRVHLDLPWQDFLQRYAGMHIGPATGLPIVSLRFEDESHGSCPFVGPKGCRVYTARPSSCRIYPLARALQRSRIDGRTNEHYALLQEPHCRGFETDQSQTVRQWIAGQELGPYNVMNDALLELIALKNQFRPGPLAPNEQQMIILGLYDLDNLKEKGLSKDLEVRAPRSLPALPAENDDEQWLRWGLQWVKQELFGTIS